MTPLLQMFGMEFFKCIMHIHTTDRAQFSRNILHRYTANPHMSRVYAIMTKWPENCERTIILGAVDGKRVSVVTMLGGYKDHLKFEDLGDKSGVRVELPAPDEIKSKWAWVIVLQMV